jgi:hypothetical protein
MTNKSQQQTNTISSKPTDLPPRFKQVLALGRKLVDELGTKDAADTLSSWMAHYIAELIDAAELGTPIERAETIDRCFKSILELWSYRSELPDGKRPFNDMEQIVRVVQSLDPDIETPRLVRVSIPGKVEHGESAQTKTLLEFVRLIDASAKVMIGHALSEAARSAADQSKEWIALAKDAGLQATPFDIVIQFVSEKADLERKSDLNEHERKLLNTRVSQLDAFTKFAALVSEDLKRRLEALPTSRNSG